MGLCLFLAGPFLFLDFMFEFFRKSTEKIQIRGTPSGSQPAFEGQPALKSDKNDKNLFFVRFQMFFLDFRPEITEKVLE